MSRNRLTRITTRTGDAGSTRLATGEAVPKTDVRVRALGAVDELASALGALRAALPSTGADAELIGLVQQRLFDVGALAGGAADFEHALEPGLAALDAAIAERNAALPPLREFVVPGESAPGAFAHLARAVCRRAEIALWDVHGTLPGAVPDIAPVYLNRLADLLFVIARRLDRDTGKAEPIWER